MKLVMFNLKDGPAVCINPEQVCALIPVTMTDGGPVTDIVLSCRALTYRVKGELSMVASRLRDGQ